MKWSALFSIAAVSLLLPISAYASQFNLEANNASRESASVVSQTIAQATSEGRRSDRKADWLEQLNLTPEQSEQIRAIREQSKAENQSLRQQMQQAREQMRSLLASDATPEQLRQQHDSIQNLHQQLSDRRFETVLEMREVLTPEQRTQAAELMQQHKGRYRQRGAE
jgi:Spy/CpxP family protein refolding chaperone